MLRQSTHRIVKIPACAYAQAGNDVPMNLLDMDWNSGGITECLLFPTMHKHNALRQTQQSSP